MKVNRHNYEEYFLLYADNELNAEEKLAVENFVQQNADLMIEFEMLMQTKSAAEEIVFNDKEILLRTEGNNINEHNYEEYFLLYIDNELSAAKREEVETYVLQHPKLQNEFTGLKQTILIPEIITYDNKKDLYRTETRRVIYLKPLRLAVAAIFIGVCAIGWWLMQKPASTVALADKHPTQSATKQQILAKPVDTLHQIIINQQQIVAQQSQSSTQNKIAEKKIIKKLPATQNKEEVDVAEQKPSVKQDNIVRNPIEQNNIVKTNHKPVIENNDVAIEAVPLNIQEKAVTPAIQTNDETAGDNKSDYKLYDVAYKEINTNDDKNSLHVGAFDLNKTKVKNLFKKAGRLFGNKQDNSANEDGKIQVANFEIQTKQQ